MRCLSPVRVIRPGPPRELGLLGLRGIGGSRGQAPLNFGPRSGTAPDIQSAADFCRPFTHAGQAPVPVAKARIEDFRVDANSVIADSYLEFAPFEVDFRLDQLRPGVTKCIRQRLLA